MNDILFVNLYNILEQFKKIANKKVILWGTGKMSQKIAENMPFSVAYFVDSDEQKIGRRFCGKLIKSPEEIKLEDKNKFVIIIASSYFNEIQKKIEEIGLDKDRDLVNGSVIYNFIGVCKNKIYTEELRKFYWNLRADEIYETYKNSQEDKEILKSVLNKYNPKSVLDIGCGEGRLMDLYNNVDHVVGQDISEIAINKCKELYSNYNFETTNIEELNYKENYFDIIISNRVLSTVTKENIKPVIQKICEISKMIYINEYQICDYSGECDYFFIHEYDKLLKKYNFECIEEYKLGNGNSFMFKKMNI
ncbi:class I SAM-dependent methyltransferase [Clostridium butyricum]|uniref:class I SAM-dependent methyltransferase n=1 Tax=Clostridium butyricum TaxID=1492 RepID=UPI00374EA89E